MRKFFISVVLLVVAVKYGIYYMGSRDFFDYAEKEKPAWACQMTNALGFIYGLRNEYESSIFSFSETVRRCPNSDSAENAEFNIAETLDSMSHRRIAALAYEAYAARHPGGRRARIAQQAADFMRN